MAKDGDLHVYHGRHLPQPSDFKPRPGDGWGMKVSLDMSQAEPMSVRMRKLLQGVAPTVLMHSPAWRAEQTLNLLFPDLMDRAILEPRLGPTYGDAYNFCEAQKVYTARAIYGINPEILVQDGARAYNAILSAVEFLRAAGGTDAVLISHCPFVEASLATATNKWGKDMIAAAKGDVVRFDFDTDGRFVGFEHLVLPA